MPDTLAITQASPSSGMWRDVTAGTVVFLVALPLCLGIAVASGAPPFAGILAGIVGGILVGAISGSHTSVTGPAAGLTAIVAAEISALGSFDVFLTAVALAGLIQIILGIAKTGFIASFFPSSVIKGLLAAIGLILILKQLPYLLGHEAAGENAFEEMAKESGGHEKGHQNPIFSLLELLSGTYHPGPLVIGLVSMAILILWERIRSLKKSLIPAPLVVVVVAVSLEAILERFDARLHVATKQLVNVPVAESFHEFIGFLQLPNWLALQRMEVYVVAVTIAIVATLESMLNLEAVDNLDPKQRVSPPNRELIAQGVGNLTAGLIGGLPVTCVVVRGSVNIYAGSQSKLSTILHGCFLLAFALWLPGILNLIPLSCLAAILFMTGYKLISPKLVAQLYREGKSVFVPFVVTVLAIVLTDLLIGILIGLGVSLLFILSSNTKRPIHKTLERHLGVEVHHIELANQVSFLSRAVLEKSLREVPPGGHALLDARYTDYLDPDIISFLHEFRDKTAPALGIRLSLKGFPSGLKLDDDLQYVDHSTLELQRSAMPQQVLQWLIEGNQRFCKGECLERDLVSQLQAAREAQFPLAVVMTCMDSRTPTQTVFDMGIGDLLNISQAGNALLGPRNLASVEYGCAVAGARLIVILGHVGSAVLEAAVAAACGCATSTNLGEHFDHIVSDVRKSIDDDLLQSFNQLSPAQRAAYIDKVAYEHVLRNVRELPQHSQTIRQLLDNGSIAIIGAMVDPATGAIQFLPESAIGNLSPIPSASSIVN